MKTEQINQTGKLYLATLMFLASATFASAQISKCGNYKLDQSVIAGGGGTSADAAGNLYSIMGAIGQSIAGSGASNSPYSLQSGFFTDAALFGTTAATVTISGRVLIAGGRGIRNMILVMTDLSGSFRMTTTTEFGYYRFPDATGETYIITAHAKRLHSRSRRRC